MSTLFILDDAPYGSEWSYIGLRLAAALAGRKVQQVRVFLMGDPVACAKAGQKLPELTDWTATANKAPGL